MKETVERPIVINEAGGWVPSSPCRLWPDQLFCSRGGKVCYFPRVGDRVTRDGGTTCGQVIAIGNGDPEGANGPATIEY